MLIEVCANSYESALNAQKGGAQRIELCADLELGGTTPSAACIQLAREKLSIQIFVLIRPRSGDFCYTDFEFEVMKQNILFCKENGVDGIVSGILTPKGEIDVERTKVLIELSAPLPFTFHRGFDRVVDPEKALQELIDLGANRILTSGQESNAWEGRDTLKQLKKRSQDRIAILAGGGIHSSNVKALVDYAGLTEVHLSGKKLVKSKMERLEKQVDFNKDGLSENDYYLTDTEEIKKVVALFSA